MQSEQHRLRKGFTGEHETWENLLRFYCFSIIFCKFRFSFSTHSNPEQARPQLASYSIKLASE